MFVELQPFQPLQALHFRRQPRECQTPPLIVVLGFGLVHLRQNYRDLLAANGVQPLSARNWDSDEVAAATTFLMVGFPEDLINAEIEYGTAQYNARVEGCPSVILIDRVTDPPEDISAIQNGRFVGQIRSEHDVGNIVGMSGGPIFCFKGHDFEPYSLAAIQSKWLPDRKMTFGCPIPVILEHAKEFLAKRQKLESSQE